MKKLDALTSLRFFAAAMIVLGHSHPLFGSFGIANNFSLSQGVSFFFTLSGFILAYNYESLPDWNSAKRFIVSRFARIWPLHIAALLLWILLITPRISMEFSAPGAMLKLLANVTLLQSWTFTAPYVLSFNGVAWSISTEAFFYVIFVFVALSPSKRLPISLALSAICTAALILAATTIPLSSDDGAPGVSMFGALYTNPLARLLEFLFGVYCAKLYKLKSPATNNISPWTWLLIELSALAAIGYALYVVARPAVISQYTGAGLGYYIYKEGIWLLWGALILVFASSRGPVARILSTRPLVFLGEISFALYLVHMIVFNLANLNAPLFKELGNLGMPIFWLICITSAAALHLTVEDPCRRLIVNWWDKKPRITIKKLYRVPQWLSLIVLVAGSAVASNYQPSTVVGVSRPQNTIEGAGSVIPANRFANGISLTDITSSAPKDGLITLKFYFTTHDDISLNRHLGIHLNDGGGNIITVVGDIVIDRSSTSHAKGFSWMNTITVKEADLKNAASIGIANFQDVNKLNEIAEGPSDWGGKRLVISTASLR